jgi:hypothetical protein
MFLVVDEKKSFGVQAYGSSPSYVFLGKNMNS